LKTNLHILTILPEQGSMISQCLSAVLSFSLQQPSYSFCGKHGPLHFHFSDVWRSLANSKHLSTVCIKLQYRKLNGHLRKDSMQ